MSHVHVCRQEHVRSACHPGLRLPPLLPTATLLFDLRILKEYSHKECMGIMSDLPFLFYFAKGWRGISVQERKGGEYKKKSAFRMVG